MATATIMSGYNREDDDIDCLIDSLVAITKQLKKVRKYDKKNECKLTYSVCESDDVVEVNITGKKSFMDTLVKKGIIEEYDEDEDDGSEESGSDESSEEESEDEVGSDDDSSENEEKE